MNLGFEHGAKLRDPRGLLLGTGVNMRHVKIRTVDELDLDDCVTLLRQAVDLAQRD